MVEYVLNIMNMAIYDQLIGVPILNKTAGRYVDTTGKFLRSFVIWPNKVPFKGSFISNAGTRYAQFAVRMYTLTPG
jgi:hypothetical protein